MFLIIFPKASDRRVATSTALINHERVLIGLAPSGVLLAAYLAYSGKPIYPLAIWLGPLLLLQALGEYSKLTYIWITKHIDKTELELEWSLAVVLLTVCLITFAVSAPSLSVKNLARAVRQVLTPVRQESDDVVRAFGLKKPILGDSGPLAQARSAGLAQPAHVGFWTRIIRTSHYVGEPGANDAIDVSRGK